MGQLGQTGTQLHGAVVDIGQEALVHAVHHHVGTSADHRVAAKGGAVGAGTHAAGDLFAQQHGTDGQTAAQALGQGNDVRLEVVVLAAQEGAGAAHAGLHLVHDEDQVLLVTELAHSLHIIGVQRHDAALALDEFQHDGAGVAVHQLLQRLDIPRRGVQEPLIEGAEIVVEHLLTGGGQGGDGAAMEAVDQGDDRGAVLAVVVHAVLAGGLDGALVGLGAGVAEEHLAHAGALAQLLGQLAAGGGVVQVGGVLQFVGLLGHGFRPGQVTVAQAVDADAAGEVQILLALGTLGIQTMALCQHHGVAVIGVQDVFVVPLDDFFRIHRCTSCRVESGFPLGGSLFMLLL